MNNINIIRGKFYNPAIEHHTVEGNGFITIETTMPDGTIKREYFIKNAVVVEMLKEIELHYEQELDEVHQAGRDVGFMEGSIHGRIVGIKEYKDDLIKTEKQGVRVLKNNIAALIPDGKEPTEVLGFNEGYVYLLKETNGIHHKIGLTKNPKNRLATFKQNIPYQVEFEHLIFTRDMYQLEQALHRLFASKRVNGEWFALDTTDIEYIKSL